MNLSTPVTLCVAAVPGVAGYTRYPGVPRFTLAFTNVSTPINCSQHWFHRNARHAMMTGFVVALQSVLDVQITRNGVYILINNNMPIVRSAGESNVQGFQQHVKGPD